MTEKLPKILKYSLGLSLLGFIAVNYLAITNRALFFLIPLMILVIGIELLIGKSRSLKYYYVISSGLFLTLFIFIFLLVKRMASLKFFIPTVSLTTLMHMVLSFLAIKFSFESDSKGKTILYFGMSLVFLAIPLVQIIVGSEYDPLLPCSAFCGWVLTEGLILTFCKDKMKYFVPHLLSTFFFFLTYLAIILLTFFMGSV